MMEPGSGSLISKKMLAQVGKWSKPWTVELDRSSCRLFARAVGHTDPIYYDLAAARARGFRDVVAPPGFLGRSVYNPNVRSPSEVRSVSQPWVTGLLNGGTDIEYFHALCAGDVIEARRSVANWTERHSRLGPMVVLQEDVEYRRDGALVAVEHDTILLIARGKP